MSAIGVDFEFPVRRTSSLYAEGERITDPIERNAYEDLLEALAENRAENYEYDNDFEPDYDE